MQIQLVSHTGLNSSLSKSRRLSSCWIATVRYLRASSSAIIKGIKRPFAENTSYSPCSPSCPSAFAACTTPSSLFSFARDNRAASVRVSNASSSRSRTWIGTSGCLLKHSPPTIMLQKISISHLVSCALEYAVPQAGEQNRIEITEN